MNCGEERRANAAVRPLEAASSPRGTVLMVTGDRNLGAAATRVLEREGYDVVTASHTGHALLAALTRRRIDVLISELTLDEMAGETLAATLRRYHPALRSVYMADQPTPKEDRVLVRPFTRDDLLLRLNLIDTAAISPAS